MKKIIFLCFIFLLFFSFNHTIHSQQKELPPGVEVPEGYVYYQYQYAYLDISLVYPEKWINYSSQERGVLIDTPDSKGSIMILGTPLFGEDYILEKLWAENKESLELAGAIFQESVPDTFSGYPAIKALHTIKIGNSNHQYLRYCTIVDDLFYTFSFHAPVAEFEKYLEEVLTVVHSISIKTVE
jgi:hypothetical protein